MSDAQAQALELPTCPECQGVVTMPPRMGMSHHTCKCSECGKTFSFLALLGISVGQIEDLNNPEPLH
jgi:hypothetical protein